MNIKANGFFSGEPRIDDLIDVDEYEVSLSVLSDPLVYKMELQRIFARTWLLLGHDSEIPNPGDFVVRDMGDDQVLVARGADGAVHVSLNTCPHRGMRVCTGEAGNAMMHRCVYHGWAFRPDGSFIGSPIEREKMHGERRAKDQLGLRKARVTLYGGLIFATWNLDGPSLEEFLGDAKWYYDTLFCRTERGLEVLGPPQRVTIYANWKTAGEQSCVDGFHTLTLHRSLLEQGVLGAQADTIYDQSPAMYGIDVGTAHGHGMRCLPPEYTFVLAQGLSLDQLSPEERLQLLPPPGMTVDMLPELQAKLSPGQIDLLAKAPPLVGGIFPNVSFLFLYVPLADGTLGSSLTLHSFVPRGPDRFEYLTWALAEKDAPDAMKVQMRRSTIQIVGTSGTIEQDDTDTWPHMTRNARGVIGAQETLKYQALLGERKPEGWQGGGSVYDGFSKDDNQWQWWLYWREVMSQG